MKKLLFTGLIISLFQCSDVIVPNISEDLVLLRAPQDGSQQIGTSVVLSWEALPDAIDYRVEVAQPSFASLQQLLVDSITTDLSLAVSLSEGAYEWRVTAFNEAYASDCCEEWSFQLLNNTSADLTNQSVVLLSPADDASTNSTLVECSWDPLLAATDYRLRLSTQSDFGTIELDTQLIGTTYIFQDLVEGAYYWQVRGESTNSNTLTTYSSRSFTVDRMAPVAPVLSLPLDSDTLDLELQTPDFLWQSSAASIMDTLYIYEDIFLDQLFWQQAVTGQGVDLDSSLVDFATGDYFWEVRSVDAAGNVSSASSSRKFLIR